MDSIAADIAARTAEGHAAFSMRGTDDRWILIQTNTFTNWANEQLKPLDVEVTQELHTEFTDGIKLCQLMEVLQNKRIGRWMKKPMNQHHYLENVTMALNAMKKDDIKLVNIGSEDIVKGNMKLILGMIWRLILRYQIGKAGKVPPKKLMLWWINAVIPELDIKNFSTDWNDGIALSALIEYCKPGLFPNWRQLRRFEALENCRNAMQTAKDNFDIPLILTPENLASPDLDELSGMTYLSYFMKVDSPGYFATLGWTQQMIPHKNVRNFQTDWNDGTCLAELSTACGATVSGWPDPLSSSPAEVIIQKSIDASKTLGIEPVISAKEIADPEVDHLGVMAYAAWHQRNGPKLPKPQVVEEPPAVVVAEPPRPPSPPKPTMPLDAQLSVRTHQTETYPNNIMTFDVECLEDLVDKTRVMVEVAGPTTKPPVTLSWHGMTAHGDFTPVEVGQHQLFVYNDGQLVRDCPKQLRVKGDASSVKLLSSLSDIRIYKNQSVPIQISARDAASGAVRVEARSPSGRVMDMGVGEVNGVYTANFTPTEVGDWNISILFEGQHIQGSPFNVRVYDAAQVKVFGLEGGSVGKQFSFSVDCTQAGEGDLRCEITHNGRNVPGSIHSEGHGIYRSSFMPDGHGIYTIRVYFAGMEVQGSPYTLEIVDSSMVTASGEGLGAVEVNKAASFVVHTHGASASDIKVQVQSPRGATVPCQVHNQNDGTVRVEYQVHEVGEYVIDVFYYGKPIQGSPFRVNAFDWNRITVHNLKSSGIAGRLVEFDIDAANAGSGNLEIMVNDGTIPCSVQNRGNRQFHASFMPKDAMSHLVQMRFNGREVPGSPWRVDIRSAAHVTATGQGLQLICVRQPAVFEVRAGPGTPSDAVVQCNITSPSQRQVPCQVINQYNGVYRIEYVPQEVGNHVIDVLYEGVAVGNTPYTAKCYDPAAIRVSGVGSGMVGKPVEFEIDVTAAGEGQLEIMVNRGSVPNTVKMSRKGVFLVSFVPRDARTHIIDIKFNGDLLPRCPIQVPILDTSRVTVQGEGIRQVAVNRSSYFRVNTQSAGIADLQVRVTSPTGRIVPAKVEGNPQAGFQVDYDSREVGIHRIDVDYAGEPVPGSPFFAKSYDSSKVVVRGICDGVVGRRCSFTVDVNDAGEGNMEISITGGGRNIQNHVRQIGPGQFEVSYTPMDEGPHTASVTFNGEHVADGPFTFMVLDASKVTARGDGLSLVRVGTPSRFVINAPNAHVNDFEVKIFRPSGQEVIPSLRDQGDGNIGVEWTASEVGDHRIEIKYHGLQIQNSPSTARAWDASRVVVSGIKAGRIAKPYNFNIDASNAGAGNLEIIISVGSDNVPNFVKAEGNAKFEVSCTPQVPDTHMISVKFNGDAVPGSPFYASIIDGTKVTASGDGLRLVPVNKPSYFNINTNGVGEAQLDLDITAPSGTMVPRNITGNHTDGFKVEYQPNEVGRHKISVRYADVDINGSPFFTEAYDTNQVRIGNIPDGIVNQPVHFDVDCSNAGEGTLTVDVRGQQTTAFTEIKPKGNNFFDVAFTPRENCPHQIHITFNQQKVPGSPFTANLFDTSQISVDWQSVRTVAVHKPCGFIVTHTGLPPSGLKATVQNPQGIPLPAQMLPVDADHTRVEFTPVEVGGHLINLQYNGQNVVGSPFTAYTYDAARVRITDCDSTGSVGRECRFTVDTSEAGQGDIDTEVSVNGQLVRTSRTRIDASHHRYVFTPQVNEDHVVSVTFNYDAVPGCPMIIKVADPTGKLMMSGDSMTRGVVEQPAFSIMQTQGAVIDVAQVQTKVTAPNSELVPAKIVQQPDGDYKVEYSSKYTGRHTVEILYAGQAIMGSPFYVEIYDPNKIRVEGVKSGMIGETIGFDIVRNEAGKAELGLTITSPSGRNVPYEIAPIHKGEHVTYVPQEAGPHHIYITYGGLEVPGCPLTQAIQDNSTASAHGDGLAKGEEDKTSTFIVDTQGRRGDLNVTVEGPNSVAKVMTEIDHSGRYIVSYIPVEVGVYNITILWNGREVAGSPYHPKVVHAGKVRCVDGWQSIIDANNQMQLEVNQIKRFELDCIDAGPGQLTAEVRGPSGTVPCEIDHRGNGRYLVSFMPRMPGEHYLCIWWADIPLPRTPFVGFARGGAVQAPPPVAAPAPVAAAPNHEKVILTGRGLQEARVNQEAEFVIDGTEAGPGIPEVKLSGVKADIQVHSQSLGDNKYRCVYTPTIPGAYLLNIQWSDRQVRGSPFKVNVVAAGDASKVVCTGEGLKVGIMGKEIKSVIDTRRAGPGELTAHCMGPHKVAYCELYDHRDGTFTLNVKPQEAGRHVLQIKYGGEHVPGSPFVLKVSAAPDASKVRVSGPGIEHGILAMFQSRFIVETRGAGAGQLTVRIRGPKGAFRVEMQRESQKDRTILCRYDPTEVGDYIVHIKWSGEHVPGSPFHVQIFDTQDELERFMAENPGGRTNTLLTNKSWNADI